jgi:hypothetical protein
MGLLELAAEPAELSNVTAAVVGSISMMPWLMAQKAELCAARL